jgi:hypothetical protein
MRLAGAKTVYGRRRASCVDRPYGVTLRLQADEEVMGLRAQSAGWRLSVLLVHF